MGRNSKNKGRKPAPEQGLKGAASLAAPSASGHAVAPPPRPARTAKHKIRKFPPQATATTSTKADENLKDRGMKEQAPHTLKQKEVPSCPSTISTDESRRTSMATLIDSALATGSSYDRGMPAETKTLEDSYDTSSASSSETDMRVQNDGYIAHTRDGSEMLRYQQKQTSPAQEINVMGSQEDSFLRNAEANGATQSSSEDGAASLNRSVDSCISPDNTKQKNVKEQEIQKALNKEPDKGQTTTGQNNPPHIGEGLKRARNASVTLIQPSAPSCDAVPQSLENADLLKEAYEETSQVAEKETKGETIGQQESDNVCEWHAELSMISQPEKNENKPPQEMGPPGEDQQTGFLDKAMQSPGKERPDVDLQEELPDEIENVPTCPKHATTNTMDGGTNTEEVSSQIGTAGEQKVHMVHFTENKQERPELLDEPESVASNNEKHNQQNESKQFETSALCRSLDTMTEKPQAESEHDSLDDKISTKGIPDEIAGSFILDKREISLQGRKMEKSDVKYSEITKEPFHDKKERQEQEFDQLEKAYVAENFTKSFVQHDMENLEADESGIIPEKICGKWIYDQPDSASVCEKHEKTNCVEDMPETFNLGDPKSVTASQMEDQNLEGDTEHQEDRNQDNEADEVIGFSLNEQFITDSSERSMDNLEVSGDKLDKSSPHEQLLADFIGKDLDRLEMIEKQVDQLNSECDEHAPPSEASNLKLIDPEEPDTEAACDRRLCQEIWAFHPKDDFRDSLVHEVNNCSPHEQLIADSADTDLESHAVAEEQDHNSSACKEQALPAVGHLKLIQLADTESDIVKSDKPECEEAIAHYSENETKEDQGKVVNHCSPTDQFIADSMGKEGIQICERQVDLSNLVCEERALQSALANLKPLDLGKPEIHVEEMNYQETVATSPYDKTGAGLGGNFLVNLPNEQLIETKSVENSLKSLDIGETQEDSTNPICKEQASQSGTSENLFEQKEVSAPSIAVCDERRCKEDIELQTKDEIMESPDKGVRQFFPEEQINTYSAQKDLKKLESSEAPLDCASSVLKEQTQQFASEFRLHELSNLNEQVLACEKGDHRETQDETKEGQCYKASDSFLIEHVITASSEKDLKEEDVGEAQVNPRGFKCDDQIPPSAACEQKLVQQEEAQDTRESQEGAALQPEETREYKGDQVNKSSLLEERLEVGKVHQTSSSCEDQAPALSDLKPAEQEQTQSEAECQGFTLHPADEHIEGTVDQASDCSSHETLLTDFVARDLKCLDMPDVHIDHNSSAREEQAQPSVAHESSFFQAQIVCEKTECQEVSAIHPYDDAKEGQDDDARDFPMSEQLNAKDTKSLQVGDAQVDLRSPVLEDQPFQFVPANLKLHELETPAKDIENKENQEVDATFQKDETEGKDEEVIDLSSDHQPTVTSMENNTERHDMDETQVDSICPIIEEQAPQFVTNSKVMLDELEEAQDTRECQNGAVFQPEQTREYEGDGSNKSSLQEQLLTNIVEKSLERLEIGKVQEDQNRCSYEDLAPPLSEWKLVEETESEVECQEIIFHPADEPIEGKVDEAGNCSPHETLVKDSADRDLESLNVAEAWIDHTSSACEEQAQASVVHESLFSQLEQPERQVVSEKKECQEIAALHPNDDAKNGQDHEARDVYLSQQFIMDSTQKDTQSLQVGDAQVDLLNLVGEDQQSQIASANLKPHEMETADTDFDKRESQEAAATGLKDETGGNDDKVIDSSSNYQPTIISIKSDKERLDTDETKRDNTSPICEEQASQSITSKLVLSELEDPHEITDCQEGAVLQTMETREYKGDEANRSFLQEQLLKDIVGTSLDQAPSSRELKLAEEDEMESEAEHQGITLHPSDEPMKGEVDKVSDCSPHEMLVTDSAPIDLKSLDAPEVHIDHNSSACEEQVQPSVVFKRQTACEEKEYQVLHPNHAIKEDQDDAARDFSLYSTGKHTESPQDSDAHVDCSLVWEDQSSQFAPGNLKSHELETSEKYFENQENQEDVATCPKDETGGKDDKVIDSSSNDQPIIISIKKDKEKLDMDATQVDKASPICEEQASQSMTTTLVLDGLEEAQDTRECHEAVVLQPEETNEYKGDRVNRTLLQEQPLTDEMGKYLKGLEVGEVQEDQTSCPHDDRAPPSSGLKEAEQEETHPEAECQEATLHLADEPIDLENRENQEAVATSPKDETEGKDDKVVSSSNDPPIIASMEKDKERLDMDETQADTTSLICEERAPQSMTSKLVLDELKEAQDKRECHHEGAVLQPEETKEYKDDGANSSSLQEQILTNMVGKSLKRLEVGDVQEDQTSCPRDDRAPPSSELKQAEQEETEAAPKCQEVTLHLANDPMDFEDGENQEGAATSPKDETEGKDDKVIDSSSNDQQIIVSMGKDKERIDMEETKVDNTTNICEEQELQSTTSKTMLDELEEAQDTTECHECAVVRPKETGENKCVEANESCLQEQFLKDIMEKILDQAPPSSELKLAEQGKMESEAECQEVTLHPADECIECKVDEVSDCSPHETLITNSAAIDLKSLDVPEVQVAHTRCACQEQAQPSEPESSLFQREIVCEKKECQELLALHPNCDAQEGKDDEARDTSLPKQLITESTVKDNEPLQVSDAPGDLTTLVWLDQQSHIAPTNVKPHELETPDTDLENKENQEDVATNLKDETGGKDDNVIDSSLNNQPNIFMEKDKERLDLDETQVDNTSPICEERAPQFLAGEPVLHELEEAQDTRECHEVAVLQPEETKEYKDDNANKAPLQEQILTGIMGTSLERHGVGEVQEDQTSSSCDNLSPPLSELKTTEQERTESEEECQDLTLHPADEPIEDKVGEASDCSSHTTIVTDSGALDLKSLDVAEVRMDHTSPPYQEQAQPSALSESLFFQREIVLEKNECQEATAIHPNGDAKEGQNNEAKDLFSPEQLVTDSPTTGEMIDAWQRVTLHTADEFIEGELDEVSNCSLGVAEVQIDQPNSGFDEQAQSVTSKPALDEFEEPEVEPSTVVCDKDECTSSVQKEQAEQLASRLMLQDLAQQQEDEVSICGKGNQTETVTLLPIETKQGQSYEASDLFLHKDVITGSLEKDLEREEVGEPQVVAKCFTCDDGEPQFAASEPKLVEQEEPEAEEGKDIRKYQEGTVFQPKETKECKGDGANEASPNKQLLTDCMERSLERLENGEVQVDQTSYSCEDQAPPSSELKSAEQKETETKATGEIRECQIVTLSPADEPKEGKADKASDCSHNVVEVQVDDTSPACEEQAQPVVVGESLSFQPEQPQRDIVCEKKEGQEVVTLHFNGDDSEGQDNNARDFNLPGQLITDSTVKDTESLQINDEKEDLKSLVRENQPAEFATANLKTHELMETSETEIEDRENEEAVATSPKDITGDKDDEVLDSKEDLMGERMGEMQVGPKIFICDGHVPPSGVSAQNLVEQEEPETEEVQSTKERKEDAICQPEKTNEQICDNANELSLKEQLLTDCMEKSLEKLEAVNVPVDQTSCACEEQAPPSNALKLAEHKETETKATGELGECQGFTFHPADELIEGKAYKARNYSPDVAEVQVDQTSAACEKQAQPSVVSEPLFLQLEQLDREIVCEKKEYQGVALCPNDVAKEGQADETRDISLTEQLIANPAEENTENLQVSDALDLMSRVWEDPPSQFAPMNLKPHELETPDTDLEKKGNQAAASSLKDEAGGKDDKIIDSCSNDQPIIISIKKDKESLDMDEKQVDNTSPIFENQAPETMVSEPVLDELEELEPEPEKSNVVCDERDCKCSVQEEQAQQFASESKLHDLAQLEEEVCICEEGDRRETETLLPDGTKESQVYEASDSLQKDLEGEGWDEPLVDPEGSSSDSQVPPSEPKLVEQEEPEAEEAQYMKGSQEGAVFQPAEEEHNDYDKAYKFSLQDQLLTGCMGKSLEKFEVGEVQENQTSCTGEGQAPPSGELTPSVQEEMETGATGSIRECQGVTFLLTNELKEDKVDEASNCFPHETLVTESACIASRSLDVAEVQEEHRSSAYEEQTQPSIHSKSFACDDQVPLSAANEWKLVEQKQVEAEEAQDKKECQEGAVLQPEETNKHIGEKANNIFLQEQFLMEGLQVGEVMVDQASYACKDQILPSSELKLEEQKETQEKTTIEIGDCLEVILPAHEHKESKIDKASDFSPDVAEVQVYHTSATCGEQAQSLVICEPSSFWLEHSKREIESDENKGQDDTALHPNGAAKEGQDDRAGDFFPPEQLIIDSAVKGMESLQVSAAQEDLTSIVSEDQLFHFAPGNLKTHALETPGRDVENRKNEEAFESRENQEAIATGPNDETKGKDNKLIDSSSNDQPFTTSMEKDKERLDVDETQMGNTSSICEEEAPQSVTSKPMLDELQEPQPSKVVCDESDCIGSVQEEQAQQFASELKHHDLAQPEEEVSVCEKGEQREIESLLPDKMKESQGYKAGDSFLNEHVITASSEKDLEGEEVGEVYVDGKSFTCDDQVPPPAASERTLVELEDSEAEEVEYAKECQQSAVVHDSSSNDQPVPISIEKDKERLDMDKTQMENTCSICEEQGPQSATSKLALDELQEQQPSTVVSDERDCISSVQEQQAQQFASESKFHKLAQPEEEVFACEKGGQRETEALFTDQMKENQGYKAGDSFLNENVITASSENDLEGEEVGEAQIDWKGFTLDDQVLPSAASEPKQVELGDSEAEGAEYAKECQQGAGVHHSSSNDQPVTISMEKDKERLDMDERHMENTSSICEEQTPQSVTSKLALDELQEPQPSTVVCDERDCVSSVQEEQAQQFARELNLHDLAQPEKEVFVCEKGEQRETETSLPDEMKESKGCKVSESFLNEHVIPASSENDLEGEKVGEAQVDWISFTCTDQVLPSAASEPRLVELEDSEAVEAEYTKECQQGAVVHDLSSNDQLFAISTEKDNERIDMDETQTDNTSSICEEQAPKSTTSKLVLDELQEPQPSTVVSDERDCISSVQEEQAQQFACESKFHKLAQPEEEVFVCEKGGQREIETLFTDQMKESQGYKAGDSFLNENVIKDSSENDLEGKEVGESQIDWKGFTLDDQVLPSAASEPKLVELGDSEAEEAEYAKECQQGAVVDHSSSNDQPLTIFMEKDKERLDMDETHIENTSSICEEQAPQSVTSKLALDELQEPQPSTVFCDERNCISYVQEEQVQQFASDFKIYDLAQLKEEVFVREKGGQREIETLFPDEMKESQGYKAGDSILNEHVITASSEKDLEGEDVGEAQVDWKSFTCDDQVPPSSASEPTLVELEDSEVEGAENAKECQQGAVVHHSSSNDQPITISTEKDKEKLDMDETHMENTSSICEEQAPQSVTNKLALDELQEPQPGTVVCDKRDCISSVQEEQAQQFASELNLQNPAQLEKEVFVCEKGGQRETETLLPDKMKESKNYKASDSFMNEHVIPASSETDLEGEEVGEAQVDWKSFTCNDQVPPSAASEPRLELEDSEAEEAEYTKECQQGAVDHNGSSNDQLFAISTEKDKERIDMDETQTDNTSSICDEQVPKSATSKLALDELQEPQPTTVVSDERDFITSVQEQEQQFASELELHELAEPEEEVFVCEKEAQRQMETLLPDAMKESQGYKASDSFLKEYVITTSSENDLEGEEVGETQVDWKSFTCDCQVPPSAASEPKLVELKDSEAEAPEYAKECQNGAAVHHSSSNDQLVTISIEKDKERLDMDETQIENASSICEEQAPQSVTSEVALDELQQPQPNTVVCDEGDCISSVQEEQAQQFASESKLHILARPEKETFVCEKGGRDEMKESQDYKAGDSFLNEHVITASSEKDLEGEEVGEAQVACKSFTSDNQLPPSAASEPTLVELEDSEAEEAKYAKECQQGAGVHDLSSNDQPCTISMEKDKERLDTNEAQMDYTSSICEEQAPKSATSELALDELQEPQPSTVVSVERDCITSVQEDQSQQFASVLKLHELAQPEEEVFVCEEKGQRKIETLLPDVMKESQGYKAGDSFLNEHVITASSEKDLEGEEVGEALVDWESFTSDYQVPPSAAREPELAELEDSEAKEAEYAKECQQGAVVHNSSSNDPPVIISMEKDKERLDMDETQMDNTCSICEEQAPQSGISKLALDELQEPQPSTVVYDERDCISSVQEEQAQQFPSELKLHDLAQPEEEVSVCEKGVQIEIETLLTDQMKASQNSKAGDSFLNEHVITASSEKDLKGEEVGEAQVDWKSFTSDDQVPPSVASEPKLVELEDSEVEAAEYAKKCQQGAVVHHSSSNDQPDTISMEKDMERLDMDKTQMDNTSSICEIQVPQSMTSKQALAELQQPQPSTVVCDERDCISSLQEEQAQKFASELKLHELTQPEEEVFVCEKGGQREIETLLPDAVKESQSYKSSDFFLNEHVITASSEKDLEGEEVREAQVDWKSFICDDQVPPSAASEPKLVELEDSEAEAPEYAECQQGAVVHDSSSNNQPITISMEKDNERLDMDETKMDNTSSVCEEKVPQSVTSKLVVLDELQEPHPSTVVCDERDCISSVQEEQAQQLASELKLHELAQPEEELFVCEQGGQREIETLLTDQMKESQDYKASDSFLNEHVITASSENNLKGEEVDEAQVDWKSFTCDDQVPPSAPSEPKLVELEDSEAVAAEYAKECQQGAVVHHSSSNDQAVTISTEEDMEGLDMDKTQMDNTSSICEEQAPQSNTSKLALDELQEPQPSTVVCDERDGSSSLQEEQAQQFASRLKLHGLAQPEEEVFVCEKGGQRENETLLTDQMKESQGYKASDSFLNEHVIAASSEKDLEEEEVGEAQVDWKSFISAASEPKLVELEDSEAKEAEYIKECQQGAVVYPEENKEHKGDKVNESFHQEQLLTDCTEGLEIGEVQENQTICACEDQAPPSSEVKIAGQEETETGGDIRECQGLNFHPADEPIEDEVDKANDSFPHETLVTDSVGMDLKSLDVAEARVDRISSACGEQAQPSVKCKSLFFQQEQPQKEIGGETEECKGVIALHPNSDAKEGQGDDTRNFSLPEQLITDSTGKDRESLQVSDEQVDHMRLVLKENLSQLAPANSKPHELETPEVENRENQEAVATRLKNDTEGNYDKVICSSSNDDPIMISMGKYQDNLGMDEAQVDTTSPKCEEQALQSVGCKLVLNELKEAGPETSTVVCDERKSRETIALHLEDGTIESQAHQASLSSPNEQIITYSDEKDWEKFKLLETRLDQTSYVQEEQAPEFAASKLKLRDELGDPEDKVIAYSEREPEQALQMAETKEGLDGEARDFFPNKNSIESAEDRESVVDEAHVLNDSSASKSLIITDSMGNDTDRLEMDKAKLDSTSPVSEEPPLQSPSSTETDINDKECQETAAFSPKDEAEVGKGDSTSVSSTNEQLITSSVAKDLERLAFSGEHIDNNILNIENQALQPVAMDLERFELHQAQGDCASSVNEEQSPPFAANDFKLHELEEPKEEIKCEERESREADNTLHQDETNKGQNYEASDSSVSENLIMESVGKHLELEVNEKQVNHISSLNAEQPPSHAASELKFVEPEKEEVEVMCEKRACQEAIPCCPKDELKEDECDLISNFSPDKLVADSLGTDLESLEVAEAHVDHNSSECEKQAIPSVVIEFKLHQEAITVHPSEIKEWQGDNVNDFSLLEQLAMDSLKYDSKKLQEGDKQEEASAHAEMASKHVQPQRLEGELTHDENDCQEAVAVLVENQIQEGQSSKVDDNSSPQENFIIDSGDQKDTIHVSLQLLEITARIDPLVSEHDQQTLHMVMVANDLSHQLNVAKEHDDVHNLKILEVEAQGYTNKDPPIISAEEMKNFHPLSGAKTKPQGNTPQLHEEFTSLPPSTTISPS